MENGWIKLHRRLLDNPISKKPNYAWLWVYLLLKANHKENKIMWNGETIIIKEGQILTGRKELSKETGIPETTIERALNHFEKNGHQIGQQKTTKYRVITVLNWKTYQQADNKRTTNGQQTDTNKNVKNDNNVKNDIYEQSSQDIVELINIFKTINPTINFGNKTTRKAAADLIKQFGKEKTLEYATYAISIFGKPYAPQITTPYELREKLSKLAAFHTSEKNKKEKVTVTKTF